jgi:hypothetical protein
LAPLLLDRVEVRFSHADQPGHRDSQLAKAEPATSRNRPPDVIPSSAKPTARQQPTDQCQAGCARQVRIAVDDLEFGKGHGRESSCTCWVKRAQGLIRTNVLFVYR